MNIRYLSQFLTILALGLFTSTSFAFGKIIAVSAPESAVQGNVVTIKVTGKGTCGSWIKFGDGRTSRRASRAFPHFYTHSYSRTGTFTIKASGCILSTSPYSTSLYLSDRIRIVPRAQVRLQTLNDPNRFRVRARLPAVTCRGRRATIVGTNGNDVLRGTPGDDVIHGLGGNDSIYGLGGNDTICGGRGNDRLYGGLGNDRLYGGLGNNIVFGGGGNDLVHGGTGNDRLYGGPGNDRLGGGSGNDYVYGGPGNDSVSGEGGDDRVYGEGGDDVIYGASGNDVLSGGPGNDRCFGGAGTDSIASNGSCEYQNSIP